MLGNHDLHWLKKDRVKDRALRDWLRAQPIVRLLDGVVLVHGGLHPLWDEAKLRSLDEADADYAVNVRYCDGAGRRPESDWPPPGPPFRPWDDWYQGQRRVVFGHWARRGLVVRPQCVGLDTGCVYGGELSAWIAEEDRIVRVPGHRG